MWCLSFFLSFSVGPNFYLVHIARDSLTWQLLILTFFLAHQKIKNVVTSWCTRRPFLVSLLENMHQSISFIDSSLTFILLHHLQLTRLLRSPEGNSNLHSLDSWFRELPIPKECIFGWDHMWMPNNEVGSVCPWNTRQCHKACISSNSENSMSIHDHMISRLWVKRAS